METASILVVEDDPTYSRLLCAILGKAGHSVVCVETANEALAILATQDMSLVIADIALPDGMDGIAFTSALRTTHRGQTVPVLVTTGYGRNEERDKALSAGATRYMVKPFGNHIIRQVVAEMLSGAVKPAAS